MSRVDADRALSDLAQLAPEIGAAVLLDESGGIVVSTLAGPENFARSVRALVDAADSVRRAQARTLTRLHAATRGGSVFAVRGRAGWLAATAPSDAEPTLAFHALGRCLDRVDRQTTDAAA